MLAVEMSTGHLKEVDREVRVYCGVRSPEYGAIVDVAAQPELRNRRTLK
jgi:hypothetical protein